MCWRGAKRAIGFLKLGRSNMKKVTLWLLFGFFFVIGIGTGWLFPSLWRYVVPTASTLRTYAKSQLLNLRHNLSNSAVYTIKTTSRSYFARNAQGSLIPKNNGKGGYEVHEDSYVFDRQIESTKTALIVMDPWQIVARHS